MRLNSPEGAGASPHPTGVGCRGGGMAKFIYRWFNTTFAVLTVLSIAACGMTEPYTGMLSFAIVLFGFPISFAIMGLVLLIHLLTKTGTYRNLSGPKKKMIVAICVSFLPMLLLTCWLIILTWLITY